jgi:hypothetical protein
LMVPLVRRLAVCHGGSTCLPACLPCPQPAVVACLPQKVVYEVKAGRNNLLEGRTRQPFDKAMSLLNALMGSHSCCRVQRYVARHELGSMSHGWAARVLRQKMPCLLARACFLACPHASDAARRSSVSLTCCCCAGMRRFIGATPRELQTRRSTQLS